MKKCEKGFTLTEGLLVILILSVASFVGYYVWNQQKKDTQQSQASTSSSEESTVASTTQTPTPASTSTTVDNKYFTIKLPQDWNEDKTTEYKVSKDAAFIYSDGKGRKAVVIVNIGDVGGAGDAPGTYVISGDSFKFNKLTFFEPCTEGYGCDDTTDGKLRVQYSSAEKAKGNNYTFDISDSNTQTQAAADVITAILETIQVK